MKVQEEKNGKMEKPLSFPTFLDFSGPMVPSYVLCFMSTDVSFVPRTGMEVFVP